MKIISFLFIHFLWCFSTLASGASLYTPKQVKDFFNSGRFVTPCPKHPGGTYPYEGSGICTGNLMSVFAFATTNLALIHNSVTSKWNFGYGAGLSLSIDKRIYMLSKTEAFILEGDGSKYDLKSTGTGKWSELNRSRLETNISTVPEGLKETLFDGTVSIYGPIAKDTYGLKSTTDRFGNTVSLLRNSDGIVTEVDYPYGRKILLSRTSNALDVTGIANEKYKVNYDAAGRLTSVSNPDGTDYSVTYPSGTDFPIATIKHPNGVITRYVYGEGGVLSALHNGNYLTQYLYSYHKVTTATSSTKTVENFDKEGFIQTATENGVSTHYHWFTDDSGRPTSTLNQYDLGLHFSYHRDEPFPYQVVDDTNRQSPFTVNYEYDSNFHLTKATTTEKNLTVVSTFDPSQFGVMTSQSKNGLVTQYQYDKGNLVAVMGPTGAVLSRAKYDPQGKLLSFTDSAGFTTAYQYKDGLLAAVTDPFGRTTSFERNVLGNITRTVTPFGLATQTFDVMGRATGTSQYTSLLSNKSITSEVNIVRSSNGAIANISSNESVNGLKMYMRGDSYDPNQPGRTTTSTWQGPRGLAVDLMGER